MSQPIVTPVAEEMEAILMNATSMFMVVASSVTAVLLLPTLAVCVLRGRLAASLRILSAIAVLTVVGFLTATLFADPTGYLGTL